MEYPINYKIIIKVRNDVDKLGSCVPFVRTYSREKLWKQLKILSI